MSKGTVYYFECYNIIEDKMVPSKSMSTLEWIKEHNCNPFKDTVKEIDSSILDLDGLYRERNSNSY